MKGFQFLAVAPTCQRRVRELARAAVANLKKNLRLGLILRGGGKASILWGVHAARDGSEMMTRGIEIGVAEPLTHIATFASGMIGR